MHERFLASFLDLLQRLQTITYKSRAKDEQFSYALVWHLFQANVGERFKPTFAEPGLKGNAVFLSWHFQQVHHQPGGCKNLVAIAMCVCGRIYLTTVFNFQAMTTCDIGFSYMPPRYTVVTE